MNWDAFWTYLWQAVIAGAFLPLFATSVAFAIWVIGSSLRSKNTISKDTTIIEGNKK